MEIVILIIAMIVVGLIVGWVAGFIWKDRSPEDARTDYIASVIAAVATGLLDWFVIPAMGFSITLRNIATATEPALLALLVLWIIRKAKS
ncbi:MAG TPA: hypothetical protein VLA72_06265 [Anaerolineales bacterium]|nr:hypothetical protein [Anaerolineales bacterium]